MTRQKIYSLIYISEITQPLSDDQLRLLLATARAHNARAGITGVLLYDRGMFLQNLEGEKEQVEALYAKITKDKRHQHLAVLIEDHIPRRHFSQWSMAFVRRQADENDAWRGFSSILENYQGQGVQAMNSQFLFHVLLMFQSMLPPESSDDFTQGVA
jgi:hypothetical protein